MTHLFTFCSHDTHLEHGGASERVSLLCLSFVLYTLSQGVRFFSI